MQTELFPLPPRDAPIGAVEQWANDTRRTPLMGVDEAGRGPLAGPVVAAAVVFPLGPLPAALARLDDSKRLTAALRAHLVPHIAAHALAVGVGRAEADEIDRINILEATREAMRRAIRVATRRLRRDPVALLVDGHLALPGYHGEQWALVKGDSRSLNIAAASVIAKVVRDRIMTTHHRRHPRYGFEAHKGYGTLAHRAALAAHGPSPVHRRSFRWTPPPQTDAPPQSDAPPERAPEPAP